MMHSWQLLKARLERRYGKLIYAAVKEEGGRTAMKHLHILLAASEYIPQRLISAMWEAISGAAVVDIRKVSSGVHQGSLHYYLTKQGHVERKSVTFSQTWPKLPKLSTTLQTARSQGPLSPRSSYYLTADGSYARFPHTQCQCHGLVIAPPQTQPRVPLPIPIPAFFQASLPF